MDEVLPRRPLRQWVLSVPFPLRFLLATDAAALTAVLGIVYRVIAAHLIRKAGLKQSVAQAGTVTLIQRFGSALNLNIHFHLWCWTGSTSGVLTQVDQGPRIIICGPGGQVFARLHPPPIRGTLT